MENPLTTAELTRRLAGVHRVLVLGGLAVISHGHTRPTYDADAWLDPTLPPQAWADAVLRILTPHPQLGIVSIGDWQPISSAGLAAVVERDGVIRVTGSNQPLDIFRVPNEFEATDFDTVWERASPLDDGTRVPDTIDLLVTKQDTGRVKDAQDIAFLEAKAEQEYLAQLPTAPAAHATAMLARFLTPAVAECATRHPDESVRRLGHRFLVELAGDGDPFAQEILRKLG